MKARRRPLASLRTSWAGESAGGATEIGWAEILRSQSVSALRGAEERPPADGDDSPPFRPRRSAEAFFVIFVR